MNRKNNKSPSIPQPSLTRKCQTSPAAVCGMMTSSSILSKRSSKTTSKSAGHAVHFELVEDEVCDRRTSQSSSTHSDSSLSLFRQLHVQHDDLALQDYSHEDEEDEDEKQCLVHLDHLGLVLEHTFQEVECIDTFVSKLRADFDSEMLSEQRYMSCICSAKIARAACCKKQIQVWKELQHSIQEFCCHHHHHHHDMNSHSDDCHTLQQGHASDSDTCSMSSHDSEVDLAVCRLNKLVFFHLVKQRLDPAADIRAFVEHWVMQSQLSNYDHGHKPH